MNGGPCSGSETGLVDMLKTALNGFVGDSQESKDLFVEEFIKIHNRQEERLEALDSANRKLQQVSLYFVVFDFFRQDDQCSG